MNAEQKQRMAHELGQWNAAMKSSCSVTDLLAISTRMAALLQELIDAPEPEPVGYTNETEMDYVRTYEALPVSGAFWPTSDEDACVALYTAPPANNQSDQHLEMVNQPALSVPDADLARDAERYRWLRHWTRGVHGVDSKPAFILPHVPTLPDQDIMRGSVAQHLNNTIDAAIERDKMKGGA